MTYCCVPWALKYNLRSCLAWAPTWDINYSCYIEPLKCGTWAWALTRRSVLAQDTIVIRLGYAVYLPEIHPFQIWTEDLAVHYHSRLEMVCTL